MQRVNVSEIEFTDDFCYRYEGAPFTGVAEEYERDGRLKCEMSFVNGIQEGISREWSSTGILISETAYRNNTLHGRRLDWRENGTKESEKIYEFGICVESKEWDEKGTLVREFHLEESDPQYALLRKFRSARFVIPRGDV
jgi:antitoxin component YwqK of YwqJK toxin-antitoxin module